LARRRKPSRLRLRFRNGTIPHHRPQQREGNQNRATKNVASIFMQHPKPKLAAFPKAYMDQLTLTGEMTLNQWFDICAELKVDGTELYSGFKELQDPKNWSNIRSQAADRNLPIPMLCCSPDFTHPDPGF